MTELTIKNVEDSISELGCWETNNEQEADEASVLGFQLKRTNDGWKILGTKMFPDVKKIIT